MFKIILKKTKTSFIIVLVQKHKVKDLIGLKINNKILIDYSKLYNYIKKGYMLSNTVLNLLYKEFSTKDIKFKSLIF